MPCLICGSPKTIDAHLIPRAFAQEVTMERGEKHIVANKNAKKITKTNTGLYDPDILCGVCDGVLGKHEHYVFEILTKARAQLTPAGKLLAIRPFDGDEFVQFAAGLCWKYCVTKPDFGRIKIGPLR